MTTFSWVPSWDMPIDETPRIREVKYGDAYAQRSPDGINTLDQVLNLTFGKRLESEALAITQFLRARRGVEAFLFRSPVLDTAKATYICKSWTPRAVEFNNFDVVCKFERDYNTFVAACLAPTIVMPPATLTTNVTLTPNTAGAGAFYSILPLGVGDPIMPIPGRDGVYEYTGPFVVNNLDVVYAMAVKDDLLDSAVVNMQYLAPI